MPLTRCHCAFDPFVAPMPSHRVADAPLRSSVALHGFVRAVCAGTWVGGPVLEVTLSDGTGDMRLAFLGRRRIGGIDAGRVVTVAGTVGSRHGHPLLMNPRYWLHAPTTEVADA